MATELATGYIALVPSASGLKGSIAKELGGAGTSAAKTTESAFSGAARRTGSVFKSALKVAAIGVAGLFTAGALGAKAALGAASDYNESLSKIGAVFGPKEQATIEKWAAGAAKGFGQSSGQALEAAGTYGNLLTSFGLAKGKASEMSTSMVELASDLASFNNASPEEALDALRSGLTGETEPLKKFGIALDDASLRAEALKQGIYDGTGTLTPAQKAQASYALILERSKNAQGDFAKTAGGAANQQRIFAARTEDLKVKVGQALLPALNAILPVLGSLFDKIGPLVDKALPMLKQGFEAISAWWTTNGPAIQATAEQVLTGLVTAFQTVAAWVQQHWPEIQAVITTAVTTVKSVIEGVVSVITVLWQNFGDNILSFVQRAWGPIQQIIGGAMSVIQGIIKTVTSLIKGDWSGVWEGIKGIVTGAWSAIQGIVKGAAEILRLAIGIVGEVIGSVWKGIWRGLTGFVSDRFDDVVGFVKGLGARITSGASGMWDGIKAAFKSVLNWIIDAWNGLEFSIPGFDPPGPGPSFGGFTLGVPNIPRFHAGGVVPGRPGQEVPIMALAGETVRTSAQEAALGTGRGGVVFEAGAIDARGIQDPLALASVVGGHIAWVQSVEGIH